MQRFPERVSWAISGEASDSNDCWGIYERRADHTSGNSSVLNKLETGFSEKTNLVPRYRDKELFLFARDHIKKMVSVLGG